MLKRIRRPTTDVSQIKDVELKIERSEKIYKTIAESIPNGSVVVFDKDLKFTLAEGSLLQRQGFNREDIVGKSAYDPLDEKTDWSYFVPYFGAIESRLPQPLAMLKELPFLKR